MVSLLNVLFSKGHSACWFCKGWFGKAADRPVKLLGRVRATRGVAKFHTEEKAVWRLNCSPREPVRSQEQPTGYILVKLYFFLNKSSGKF